MSKDGGHHEDNDALGEEVIGVLEVVVDSMPSNVTPKRTPRGARLPGPD